MDPQEKSDRLIEAACAVLDAAPGRRLNAVILNKALFYLDLASLRDAGSTVTHNTYVAIQQGPVIAKYPQRLVAELEERGYAKQLSCFDGSKPLLLDVSPESYRFLDTETILLATKVTSFFAEMSSGQASLFSHENPGWRLAWDEYRRTGQPKAVSLSIALQQIVEDDPWMEVPLADDHAALAAADAGDGDDW